MIVFLLKNMLCSFAGTIAYAILFSVPKKYYVSCGFTGMTGWLVYLFITQATIFSAAVGSFFGSLTVVLISRMLAVRMKCPITIFLVSGIFPLVPGAGVYYTAYYLVTNEMGLAAVKGLEAIKIAFGIVLGIAVVLSVPRGVFQLEYWRQRRYRRKYE